MGTRLGAYELEGELGRGATARVYRARHVPTGALRAVKVLETMPDLETLERFRREGAALEKLEGRGVVAVHETGQAQGRFFMAMDFMPRGTLSSLLRERGRLEPLEAARLVAKLARTLERSHALGLVHRDLKPANVLLDEEGEPRLADWGFVRDLSASALTQTGAAVGTPVFMSPEQLRGEPVGPATDVFSLGVLLHLALADALPHEGKSVLELARAALARRRRPLTELGVPADLERIVHGALAPEPGERPSAGDVAAALERFAGAGSDSTDSGTVRFRRRAVIFGSLLAIVATGAGAGLAALDASRAPPGTPPVPDLPAPQLPPASPPAAPVIVPPRPEPRRVVPPTDEIDRFAKGLLEHGEQKALPLRDLESLANRLSASLPRLASDSAAYTSAIAPLVTACWTLGRISQQQLSMHVEYFSYTDFQDELPRRRAACRSALESSIEQAPPSTQALVHFLGLFDDLLPISLEAAEREARALAPAARLHEAAYLTAIVLRIEKIHDRDWQDLTTPRRALKIYDEVIAAVGSASVLPKNVRALPASKDPEGWWAAWLALNAWKQRERIEEHFGFVGADKIGYFGRSLQDLRRAKVYVDAIGDPTYMDQNQRAILRVELLHARALAAAGKKPELEARLKEEEKLARDAPGRDGIYLAEVARIRGDRAEALRLARSWSRNADPELAACAFAIEALATDDQDERKRALDQLHAGRRDPQAIGFNLSMIEELLK